jgi:putative hydrolase of the HAD superfamily
LLFARDFIFETKGGMCLNKVEWLFFDLGSTLIDETRSNMVWFNNASQLISGALSALEIEKEYCAGMVRGNPTIVGQLRAYGFTGSSAGHLYPSELDQPYPEAETVLRQLSRNYKLGIIANQNAGSELRLEQYGLRQYFTVVVASAEAGVKKPDPRIFRLALEQENCEPGQAAMIGDRLDNDIFPANALGFTTARILQGYGKLQVPKSLEYEPDFTVDTLMQTLDIF